MTFDTRTNSCGVRVCKPTNNNDTLNALNPHFTYRNSYIVLNTLVCALFKEDCFQSSEDLRSDSSSSSSSQLKDALDGWPNSNNNQAGGGGSWSGQPNAPLWPGTPAPLQIRLHPHTEGRNQVCLCQQVSLLPTPPGQEIPLEVDLCGLPPLAPLVPSGLDLQQGQDPQLVI